MRLALIVLGLSLSACGLDPLSVAEKALSTNDEQTKSQDCTQQYALVSYLENHTNQAVNLTLTYENWHSEPYGRTVNVPVQIPAGGTFNGNLGTVTGTGYADTCSSTPETELVDLSGDMGSFRKCSLKTGVAYLIDASAQCPVYTYEN